MDNSSLADNPPGSPGFYHGKLFTNSNLEQPSGFPILIDCWSICLNLSDVGQHGAPLSLHVSLGPGLAHSLGVPGHGGQPRCQGGHRDKAESWVQIPMKIISYLLESGDVYLNWAIIGITWAKVFTQYSRWTASVTYSASLATPWSMLAAASPPLLAWRRQREVTALWSRGQEDRWCLTGPGSSHQRRGRRLCRVWPTSPSRVSTRSGLIM